MTIVHLASKSAVKRRNFAELLGPYGFEVAAVDVNLAEVQHVDVRTVSRSKAAQAAEAVELRPLLVDDTGLEIPDLLDAPGALLGPLLKHGGVALLDRMTRAHQRDGTCAARYVCALTWIDTDGVVEATGSWAGVLDFQGAGEVSREVRDCSALFREASDTPTLTEQAAARGSAAYLHRVRAVAEMMARRSRWVGPNRSAVS